MVFGLRNSAAATSRFDNPCATSAAIRVSWGCEWLAREWSPGAGRRAGRPQFGVGDRGPVRQVPGRKRVACLLQHGARVDTATRTAERRPVQQACVGCLEQVHRPCVRGECVLEVSLGLAVVGGCERAASCGR